DLSSTKEDPFASPYRTAKASADEKDGFDTFEPFVPKQPENTPFKVAKPKKKKDSFEDSDFDDDDDDDDEGEENIRIVIRAKMKDGEDAGADALGKLSSVPSD